MSREWLWDRKMTIGKAKRILKNPEDPHFLALAALLLARKNTPKEVFQDWLDPVHFCQNWPGIKRKMRQDRWNEPRIIFWQAVYEKLRERYQKKGIDVGERRVSTKPKDEICKAIGQRIQSLRKGLGLTQKELANQLKISQQMISRIESGRENVSLLTLKEIAKGLGARVEVNLTRL